MLEKTKPISQGINRTAERIDLAIAGDRYTWRPNESSVRISQLNTWREQGQLENSIDFGLGLKLPNLERRWKLRFTSYDEEEEGRDLQQRRIRTQARDREFGAGLFFLRQLGNVKVTFLPRLRIEDPLHMSYTLRFQSFARRNGVSFEPRFELYADPDRGTGEFLALENVFRIHRKWNLVLNNEQEYRDKGNFFETDHGLSFEYLLAENMGQGYAVIFNANNRPTYHMEGITLAAPFSHILRKDRLLYYVTPFLAFTKTRHFKGEAGLSVNFELVL